MTTVAELKDKIAHDIGRGYLEESSPGVYHPTELGATHSRLESLVSILTAMTLAAQRALLLINEPAPALITFAELAEREGMSPALAEIAQPGQYL